MESRTQRSKARPISSVARGGGGARGPPHWLVKYAKLHVFGAFEADFWWKIENSPPPKGNWVPKLWSTCRDSAWKCVRISDFGRKISFNFGEDRPPVFGLKKRLNFRAFREIPSQFSDKPCDSDSRAMKIRVNVVCTFLALSKKPPPFPNPGNAPEANDTKKSETKAKDWLLEA